AIMRFAIGGVIELVRPEPASLFCEATRDVIVIFWVLVWFFRHCFYLRAERSQQMHFLRRLIIRNHNNSPIASGTPDHGKTDPSVAGSSLNDRCSWFKPPRSFRLRDDSVGGSIFHRSGWIHEFGLSQNLATCQFGQASQSNQRRVPNVSINARVTRLHPQKLTTNRHEEPRIWRSTIFMRTPRVDCSSAAGLNFSPFQMRRNF